MLLNTNIEIVVTNDGKTNNVSTKADLNLKFQDVLTSMKLAEKNYIDMFTVMVKNKFGKLSKTQIDKVYANTTLQDLFDYAQKEAVKQTYPNLTIDDFCNIFQYGDGENSGQIMFERFTNFFNRDAEKFVNHLCSIDRAKWNKFFNR